MSIDKYSVMIKFLDIAKDILLVLIGALTTYLAQVILFNKQHKKDIEKKKKR